jgi:malonyl-CoA O-methyltransferase
MGVYMINKQLLRKHFSRNAVNYDKYAAVQKKMAHELVDFIKPKRSKFSKNIRILDIGCGTGYLTKQLTDLFPLAHITAVDIAPGMIELARENFKQKNVTFLCGDIEEMEIGEKYDLIVSNATFQWFNHLDKTIKKLYGMLNGKGIICFSTFGNQTFTELHQSYQKAKQYLGLDTDILPGQSFYSFDHLYNLCQCILNSQEFPPFLITGKECFEYEYFISVKAFLESVKKVGANNSNQERHDKSLSLLKEMIRIYDTDFREKNKIKATYHCLFFSIEILN